MRRGQAISLDFLSAMFIFVVMIITGFYLLQTNLVPRQSFTAQVEQAGETAWTNFQDETEWTVYGKPVIVHANARLDNEPVIADVPITSAAVANSTLVMKDRAELRSEHNLTSNRTVFIADVRNGSTRADVVWTEEGTLEDRNYSSGLERGGDSVWNDKLNLTFTTSGLSQLSFDGTDMLDAAADLAGGSSPGYDVDLLEANVTYTAGGEKHVRLYEDSGQVRITGFFTGEREWVLNLSGRFDTMYSAEAGGLVNLDTAGTGIYTATTDWVDFNDSSEGLSIIGDDLFVNVSRDSANAKLRVNVNFSDSGGRKDVLLYAHKGNYTNATAQKVDFYQPAETTVGVREPTGGVSRAKADDLEAKDSDTVREKLDLTGVSYNISIPGVFTKGDPVDTDTTVMVLKFPVTVLERFGNVTVKTMRFRVWE
ncbi:MAG: hypothetical protein SVU88_00620 [Candidatus Nanohaloarchaea archaeon]|nr:hypothetical protein [Candidatus Nanohaloarchaea archaeon]